MQLSKELGIFASKPMVRLYPSDTCAALVFFPGKIVGKMVIFKPILIVNRWEFRSIEKISLFFHAYEISPVWSFIYS